MTISKRLTGFSRRWKTPWSSWPGIPASVISGELADKRHRFLLVYSYLIVYRHETKPLQIIRVLHAARDVQSILGLAADEM